MSTAAPAAAGSPTPAATHAAPDAGPAESATPATPAAQPRVIKPIPPPKLPGVFDDGPEDARTRPADSRSRDASGRFVAGEPKEGEVVAKPQLRAIEGEDPAAIPDLPDATPKFKFAGKEYATQAEAEQAFDRHMKQLKPTQQKVAEYEGKLVKAAESARGWHSEAQRLAARVAELEAGAGAQPAAGSDQPAGEPKGIDWALYADISRVAAEAGEPWKAQQWLQEQVDAQRKADFESWRESFEQPYRQREAEAAEQAEMASTADTLVASMAAHTNPDGSPAFPEFRDGDQAREVGALWNSLGLDPRLALTPGGAVAAVALYRMARGMDNPPAPAAPAVSPSPDPAALAAAGLEGGRPLMPSAADRRTTDPGIARLVAGLKNTQLIRPGLGFEA